MKKVPSIALLFFSVLIFLVVVYKLSYPFNYKEIIGRYAESYGVDAGLVASVIFVESSYNPSVKSSSGAVGLMQLMPSTANFVADMLGIGEVSEGELFEIETNIQIGTYFIKYLSGKFSDLSAILCAYNAGEGNTREWLEDARYSPDGEKIVATPFPQTNHYIQKVERAIFVYSKKV